MVIVEIEVELEVMENGDLKCVIAHGLAAGHEWISAGCTQMAWRAQDPPSASEAASATATHMLSFPEFNAHPKPLAFRSTTLALSPPPNLSPSSLTTGFMNWLAPAACHELSSPCHGTVQSNRVIIYTTGIPFQI